MDPKTRKNSLNRAHVQNYSRLRQIRLCHPLKSSNTNAISSCCSVKKKFHMSCCVLASKCVLVSGLLYCTSTASGERKTNCNNSGYALPCRHDTKNVISRSWKTSCNIAGYVLFCHMCTVRTQTHTQKSHLSVRTLKSFFA